MTKRARITALITTLCICLSLFVVGVLAATTATFNVTSILKFTADGVYIMVDASLKQGADVETAAVLSGENKPTGQTTYKAYSYPRASGQDYPNGEPSTKHFVDSTGVQANPWAIGDITYTSENVVVVYEFLVSNYSEFEVAGTVEGISEALASYTDQLSISTYKGTSSQDAVSTSSPSYTFNIPKRTSETVPGQACYKIAVTLNKFTSSIETNPIEMNITFEKYVPNYFLYEGDTIVGLSEDYLNLQTKPETLIIPNNDGNGNAITRIALPNGIDTIFEGLESSNIIIQEGILTIEERAFMYCDSITSLTLPEGLITIGEAAFWRCTNISGTLNLPSSLESIGPDAFDQCSSLTGELIIPEKITVIEDAAFFACEGITSLILPSGLKSIGRLSFSLTGLIGPLTLPNGLESIGEEAFLSCSGLTGLTLPNSLKSIGKNAFASCTEITGELVIPSGVESIGNNAFQSIGITNLVVQENVGTIGDYAFMGSMNLENVILSGGSIGQNAFVMCINLTNLTINEGVKEIGNYAFADCSSLSGELIIPSSVENIGQQAFRNCTSLTKLTISAKTLEIMAFVGCTSLSSVIIDENVNTIWSGVFYDTNLTSVTFKDPNGWQYYPNPSVTIGTSLSSEDLSDPTIAATYLKSTYSNKIWRKS